MGDSLLSNFDLAKLHFDQFNIIRNFKIIDTMLEIFLFAVFSYCTFKLAIKRIDKSILNWLFQSFFPQNISLPPRIVTEAHAN